MVRRSFVRPCVGPFGTAAAARPSLSPSPPQVRPRVGVAGRSVRPRRVRAGLHVLKLKVEAGQLVLYLELLLRDSLQILAAKQG